MSGEHSHTSNGIIPGLSISHTSMSLGTDPFGYPSTLQYPSSTGRICPSGTLCGTLNGDIGCTHTSGDIRCRLNSVGLSEVDQKTETVSAGCSLLGSLGESIDDSVCGCADVNIPSLDTLDNLQNSSEMMAGPASLSRSHISLQSSTDDLINDSIHDNINDCVNDRVGVSVDYGVDDSDVRRGDDSTDALLDCSPPTPEGGISIHNMVLPSSLEERVDSDSCSNHSKDFGQMHIVPPPPHPLTPNGIKTLLQHDN